jgi:hypothetical protein
MSLSNWTFALALALALLIGLDGCANTETLDPRENEVHLGSGTSTGSSGSTGSTGSTGTSSSPCGSSSSGTSAISDNCNLGRDSWQLYSDFSFPNHLALDDQYVYWTRQSDDSTEVMKISKTPGAGSATSLATLTPTLQQGYIAVAGSNLIVSDDVHNQLLSIPNTGGTPTVIAELTGPPGQVAFDGSNLFWTEDTNGTVLSMPISGGRPTILASGESNPKGLSIDSTSIYWTSDGVARSMPRVCGASAGRAVTLSGSWDHWVTQVVSDGNNVYWIDSEVPGSEEGSLTLMPKSTGLPSLIYGANPIHVVGPVTDGQCIFWLDGGQSLLSLSKNVARNEGSYDLWDDVPIGYSTSDLKVDASGVYWLVTQASENDGVAGVYVIPR